MESPKKGNSKDKSHTVVDFYFVGPQKSVERVSSEKKSVIGNIGVEVNHQHAAKMNGNCEIAPADRLLIL